jgi:hypothetical protein
MRSFGGNVHAALQNNGIKHVIRIGDYTMYFIYLP